MNEGSDFITELCDRLIDDLDTFAKLIEWDYPLDYTIECETMIERIKHVKEDNV